MKSRSGLRLLVRVGLPLVVIGLVTVVACRDMITSDVGTVRNDASVTLTPGISAAAMRARTRLAERNPHNWVGVAHNHMLDELRREMRKPGLLTRNMCDYVLDFVTNPARLPTERRSLMRAEHRLAARAGLALTGLCRARTPSARGVSLKPLIAKRGSARQEADVSSAAYALLNDILSAIDVATDGYDLAGRLNVVLDAAGSLDAAEQEIIGATVSTAQYSYEYWQAELPAFQQELWNEYSDCAKQNEASGYSSDEARAICLEGGGAAAVSALPGSPPAFSFSRPLRFASNSTAIECSLSKHFKRLAGADAVGALSGAAKTFFTGGGILVGAAAGGAAASFASFVKSTWDLYWCAM